MSVRSPEATQEAVNQLFEKLTDRLGVPANILYEEVSEPKNSDFQTAVAAYNTRLRKAEQNGSVWRHYDVLGVHKTATPSDIKKAYHNLMRQFHPDAIRGDAHRVQISNCITGEITAAYEVLKDPDKRRSYDELTEQTQAVLQATKCIEEIAHPGITIEQLLHVLHELAETHFERYMPQVPGRIQLDATQIIASIQAVLKVRTQPEHVHELIKHVTPWNNINKKVYREIRSTWSIVQATLHPEPAELRNW